MDAAQHLQLQCFGAAFQNLPYIFDEEIASHRERQLFVGAEGQQSPVDEVAAVALGGVLIAEIREAAEHLLAGGGLLSGGAVADGICHHQRTEGDIAFGGQIRACFDGPDFFCPSHVVRIPADHGEAGNFLRIGAVGGCLTGGNQLIGGDRALIGAGNLQQKMLLQTCHLRPVGNVRSLHKLHTGIRLSIALVHLSLIDFFIKVMPQCPVFNIKRIRCGQLAAVSNGRRDGAGIHEADRSHLPLSRLAALAVRIVPGHMPDAELVVGRGVGDTEAGAADAWPEGNAGERQLRSHALLHQVLHDGKRGRVHMQIQCGTVDGQHFAVFILQNVRNGHNVLEHAAGTAGNQGLIRIEIPVLKMLHDAEGLAVFALDLIALRFDIPENAFCVREEGADGHGVTRMEGQCNHGFHSAHIHLDEAVIVGSGCRRHSGVICGSAVLLKVGFRLFVGAPDGGEGSGFCHHDVDAHTEFHAEAADAVTHKFQNLIFVEAVRKGFGNDGEGHIHGTYTGAGHARQLHSQDRRQGNVIGMAHELLHQLAAAFTDAHGAQCTVAGMGVRAQDHFSGTRHHFPHVLVEHTAIGRQENAAVAPGIGETEGMVILQDGAAHCAEGIVAVGEHIGDGEFLQSGGPGSLENVHIVVVRGHHGVEAQLQVLGIAGMIVLLQDLISHGPSAALCHSRICILRIFRGTAGTRRTVDLTFLV